MRRLAILLLSAAIFLCACACSQPQTPAANAVPPKYAAAIEHMIAVTYDGNVEKLGDMAPAAFWSWEEKNQFISLEETKEEFKKAYAARLELSQNTYGTKYSVAYKILNEQPWSAAQIAQFAQSLSNNYPELSINIEEMLTIDLEFIVTGNKSSDTIADQLIVAMINNVWYPVEENGWFAFY